MILDHPLYTVFRAENCIPQKENTGLPKAKTPTAKILSVCGHPCAAA
jgi:hypothetical protein